MATTFGEHSSSRGLLGRFLGQYLGAEGYHDAGFQRVGASLFDKASLSNETVSRYLVIGLIIGCAYDKVIKITPLFVVLCTPASSRNLLKTTGLTTS